MENTIKKIASNWNSNSGVDLKKISATEKSLNITFPKDYITFLMWSNGGEGNIGENYISLWKIEDLAILNKEYQIQKYLSENFLGIGTDGGGICYGFSIENNYKIFKCPLGDLDINEVAIVAKSVKEIFEKAMIEDL
jgi:SMI1 / KNR4 family (SUKH-1)